MFSKQENKLCIVCMIITSLSAPSTTCDAMEYITSALAQSPQGVSCYYPIPHNCTILSCPIAVGEDITIQLLGCADPPAVRVTVGNGFFTYFNHTFDHSEVISLDRDGVKQEVSVTLDQKPNQVGFQVSAYIDLDPQ